MPSRTVVTRKWGSAIRSQRELLELTQAELALAVGVSVKTVSNWERGEKAPTPERQVRIAHVLRIPPRLLFEFPAPLEVA